MGHVHAIAGGRGRSLGLVSYLDTLEIPGFLALNPEFRPAPLDQLAALYYRAWQWLRRDFKDDRHVFSLFDYGRGNFSYINHEREWQQTTGSFGKLADAHMRLMRGLDAAHLEAIPDAPTLAPIARFQALKQTGRQAGVWIVRTDRVHFALPFTTATRPGIADYLPSPHGLPGFAAPVEQLVPALTPFLDLDGGRTVVTADGADQIEPAADRRGGRASWKEWAVVGGKAAERVDVGLTSDVQWTLDRGTIVRTERLTASRPVRVARRRVSVPTTGTSASMRIENGVRTDTFEGGDGHISVTLPQADWPYTIALRATGNGADGRGARRAIPLHLEVEARDVVLEPGRPRSWTLRIRAESLE